MDTVLPKKSSSNIWYSRLVLLGHSRRRGKIAKRLLVNYYFSYRTWTSNDHLSGIIVAIILVNAFTIFTFATRPSRRPTLVLDLP